MSEILRVDRVEVVRWGRASGFRLNLPKQGFVVLYGPNESGKTSLATALAWLIAGPGTQGTLQRFGTAGETLEASLEGRFEASPLFLRARAKVTRQSSGSTARETLKATIGQTSLSRRGDLTARFAGGDFDGYRRLYWVEALEVANGSNLQEDVSVKAVFGGVNPFTEAASLANRSQKLLGALKGSARVGSARQLQTGIEALDREMRILSRAKDDWGRIETELADANREQERLETALRERQSELRSVQLALQAVADGVAAKRDSASSTLADTPEPSAADRRLHEQLTTARARIGELRAAETEEESTRRAYESAFGAVDSSWRQMVETIALGEPGIEAASEAETRLRLRHEESESTDANRHAADADYMKYKTEDSALRDRWYQQYSVRPSPDEVWEAHQARAGLTESAGRTAGAVRSGRPGRALRFIGSLLGTGGAAAATVLSVMREDWTIAALAGVAAATAAVVSYRTLRTPSSADQPSDPEQANLAEQIHQARVRVDDAREKLDNADKEQATKQRLSEGARQDYHRKLTAIAIPPALVGQFEPDVVRHLRTVRNAQIAFAAWRRAYRKAESRLMEVRAVLAAESGEPDDPGAAATRDTAEPAEARAHGAPAGAPNGERPDVRAAAPVSGIHDAADAKAWLDAACARVDRYGAAEKAAKGADDVLMQAVEHDKSVLEHVEHSSLDALRDRESELGSECGQIKDKQVANNDKITDLEVNKRSLESQENDSTRLALERSALTADIEGLVVRGLGHHLAASLLRDAAERHRKTQQPRLLQRTQEMVREVADWHDVTINPHAPTPRKATDRTDNLLVDGPRGEHTAQRLSLGAQTLLYLALRLATVEEQAEARGVRLPLILDDVLVGLDDCRAERCLKVLAEFSKRHQMILLTCHERTMQRAKAVGAAVRTLPPSQS